MKKLITLLILFVGMVSSASATVLHIGMEYNTTGDVYVYRYDSPTQSADNWDSMGDTQKAKFDAVKYGRRWYTYDLTDYASAVIRFDNWSKQSVNITGISGDDYYIYVSKTATEGKYGAGELTMAYGWNYLVFRQNIINWEGDDGNTWNDNDMHNTSHPDGDTFIFELTKAQIDASSNKDQGIRFRLRNSDYVAFNDAGTYIDGYPQIYSSSKGEQLNIAGNTTTYSHDTESTDNYWQVNIPSYDYEKIVLTAKYVNEGGYKWKISADAYVSKTVNKAQKWATLGCDGAALDLSGLTAKRITAYPLTVSSKGVITKGSAITGVLAANKGVLLETAADENVTLSIPVSAEAGTDGSTQLVATTGTHVNKVTETEYTNYILTEQDGHVGFYMVNKDGNDMLANTAYLHVANTFVPEARAFFWFEDETTGVEAVKASQKMNGEFFNLAGQRVAQPTKGLYIVNGKKVIMK